ncbi:alpha/beta hydrolase [Arthrobacter sp. SX1312]|uniref:alpha/beta hydrolase n=1 Tax=Arthrobacter sp. SX1312 TaxID=2058896 RepID=UPI0034D5632C
MNESTWGSRTPTVRFFPGFPLPVTDYGELLGLLEANAEPGQPIVIAHSRGALDALASDIPPKVPIFLLAPSVPRRRRGTRLLKGSLFLVAAIPVVRVVLSRRLRKETYRRYSAEAPPGQPLDLGAVARRLRADTSAGIGRGSRTVVLVLSEEDARYEDQLLLARRLDATVLHQPGGHLFPITQAASTASTVLAILASGIHPPHS